MYSVMKMRILLKVIKTINFPYKQKIKTYQTNLKIVIKTINFPYKYKIKIN